MADSAHFRKANANGGPSMSVRDDRGTPITELELPSSITEPGQVDDELRAAGFQRSADWTEVDDGWTAPVVRNET